MILMGKGLRLVSTNKFVWFAQILIFVLRVLAAELVVDLLAFGGQD